MYCSNCGHKNDQAAKFCVGCGKGLAAQNSEPLPQISQASETQQEPGRGATILTLGILSVTVLGFFAGIPAWIMGRGDLKKIRLGVISVSQRGLTLAGMILGIIGTSVFIIIVTVIILVTTTVITVKLANNGSSQLGLSAVSPTYAANGPSVQIFDGIDQIRGTTADDPAALFMLQVSLGYDKNDKEVSVELDNRKRQVQDLIIKFISQKKAVDLGATHYDELTQEILLAINSIMTSGKIKSVIFKTFIVQK